MTLKFNKYYMMKKNLKLILDTMVPGDNYMPCFTRAINIKKVIIKLNKNKDLQFLCRKKINLNEKKNWDYCVKILGNDILDSYFTSNLVIKALNLRKKNLLRNVKKENITSLLKGVNLKKKYYRK
tara:strand:+ start:16340 stop:16714 length:375 start_codon:yes stop_codon:yes gene_type:complete